MNSFEERKRNWLDLLLQHAVPETVARSCIQDVADDAQLIDKIKDAVPDKGAGQLVQVLSFPEDYKRPWLNVFLKHGLPVEHARGFVLGIERFTELEAKIRRLAPGERGKRLIEEVCTFVWRMFCVSFRGCIVCVCVCVCACVP